MYKFTKLFRRHRLNCHITWHAYYTCSIISDCISDIYKYSIHIIKCVIFIVPKSKHSIMYGNAINWNSFYYSGMSIIFVNDTYN